MNSFRYTDDDLSTLNGPGDLANVDLQDGSKHK